MASRAERNNRPSDDVDDSIAHEGRLRIVYGEHAVGEWSHTAVGRRGTAGTDERSPARTPSRQLQPSMPRRVAAGALSRAGTALKVILGETHAKRRVLERTTPIHTRSVNGGARPIDRQWSWAGRQVRGVDDDVVTTRIREHNR